MGLLQGTRQMNRDAALGGGGGSGSLELGSMWVPEAGAAHGGSMPGLSLSPSLPPDSSVAF